MISADLFALSEALKTCCDNPWARGAMLSYPSFEEVKRAYIEQLPVTVRIVAGLDLSIREEPRVLEQVQTAQFRPDEHQAETNTHTVPVQAYLLLSEFVLQEVTGLFATDEGGYSFAGTLMTQDNSGDAWHTNYLFSVDNEGRAEWEIRGHWKQKLHTTH